MIPFLYNNNNRINMGLFEYDTAFFLVYYEQGKLEKIKGDKIKNLCSMEMICCDSVRRG